MGTKGASGIERVMFGSVTLTAIRHLTWPVICVPPGKEYGQGIKKIGFACDFRKVIETTPIHFIKDIVREFNAELHVLNVDFENRHFKPETPEQSLMLHTMLEDVNPSYHFIEQKDVEDGINQFAEKNSLDLIIAIPKKHKLLEGIFKPSSTKQLVFESHIPVMCVHE
jgi:nucleotide-binding universal stress UspA family protein